MAEVPVLRVPYGPVQVPERVRHPDGVQLLVPGQEAVDVGQCVTPRRKPVYFQGPQPEVRIGSAFQLQRLEESGHEAGEAGRVGALQPVPFGMHLAGVGQGLAEPVEFHQSQGRSHPQVAVLVQLEPVGGGAAVDDARGLADIFKVGEEVFPGSVVGELAAVLDDDEVPGGTGGPRWWGGIHSGVPPVDGMPGPQPGTAADLLSLSDHRNGIKGTENDAGPASVRRGRRRSSPGCAARQCVGSRC